MKRVNYDLVAQDYDARYAASGPPGIESTLRDLTREARARSILEVGCGTGQWLACFPYDAKVFGVDLSTEMLQRARGCNSHVQLIRAHANELPFHDNRFDFLYCIHALHHFDDPERFINDSIRLIHQGGTLAIIGMDPSAGRDRWYLYDYFPGTHESDLDRYPSRKAITKWMMKAGYQNIDSWTVSRIQTVYRGREVFSDPVLNKNATSQLTLLSDEEFDAGMSRIEKSLHALGADNESISFVVDIYLPIVVGRVPESK
jgi:ubiquinone/menaquinone biosynthesis C-methylase UbiE